MVTHDTIKRLSNRLELLKDIEAELNRLRALREIALDPITLSEMHEEAMALRAVMIRVLAWRGIKPKREGGEGL
jgi:hypothetical protein